MEQALTAAWLTARLFAWMQWPIDQTYRVTTHSKEAWPRGRKKDPEGGLARNPIWSRDDVITLLPRFRGVEPLRSVT